MSNDVSTPIELDFKSARSSTTLRQDRASTNRISLRTFTSYSFDKNILTPASPFRFTAPGINKSERFSIRSGDTVELFVIPADGSKKQIATGFIDETDTHVIGNKVEYVLTGRDVLAQLVDNASVDASNKVVHTEQTTLSGILKQLLLNTRIPQAFVKQQVPNGKFLFQTQPGETKINALQRYMEFANCLVWPSPNGQLILGKPNFTKNRSGQLIISRSEPTKNNLIEARSRRNLNTAIRSIVTQLQSLELVDAGSFTVRNSDPDIKKVRDIGVGRSVFRSFSYGQGNDVINQVIQVGNTSGDPSSIGHALSLREIARENMKVLDIECVVRGHTNENNEPYDLDQIYNVQIEDDEVAEDMYVYAVKYDLTIDHGRLTTLRLCRLGTIVAYADQMKRKK